MTRSVHWRSGVAVCRCWALILFLPVAAAAAPRPLPEPLTLDYALSLADDAHPDLEEAKAELELAEAGLLAAQSRTGTRVSIEGRLRWVQPPDISPDQEHGDHRLSLFVRKPLYDFGRSGAGEEAARAEILGQELAYADIRARHRVDIMARFFDVLIADLEFARDNEAMAVAYVSLDRLKKRRELGQASDIDVAKLESEYQGVRRRRTASEGRQRATRARLADALNRPGLLPAELVKPQLPQLVRELPEFQVLLDKVLADNPRLRSLRAQLDAAHQHLREAKATGNPLLSGELETSAYTRKLGSYDKWRAGVTLEIPLYTGGAARSATARGQAQVHKLSAQLQGTELGLRQTVLELWLELQTLRAQREEMGALDDYRELYLDRSRADYEMEYKADLGDAMVRLTEAQLAAARTDFQTALVWARLDALGGGTAVAATGAAAEGKP